MSKAKKSKSKSLKIENIIPDVEWKTEERLIKDLNPHPKNPRILSHKTHQDLINSLQKYNYVELAAVNLDNTILAGHQRIMVMKELEWGDKKIEVRVPSRILTEKECDNYLLISNKVIGNWDWDLLEKDFDFDQLIEVGFTKQEMIENFENPLIELETPEEINFDERLIIEITCENEKDQKKIFEEFEKRGYKCKILTL